VSSRRIAAAALAVAVVFAIVGAFLLGRSGSASSRENTAKAVGATRTTTKAAPDSEPDAQAGVDALVAKASRSMLSKAGYTQADAHDWESHRGRAWDAFIAEYGGAYFVGCTVIFKGNHNVSDDGTVSERDCGDSQPQAVRDADPGRSLDLVAAGEGVTKLAFKNGQSDACSFVSSQTEAGPTVAGRRIREQWCIDHFG
jgi:hypothetical protein